MGHLEVIRPRVNHVFHLGSVLSIERPTFDRGFVSFRRRSLVGLEVEHVELFYRVEGDKPLVLRLNPRGVAQPRGAPARVHAAVRVPDRAGRAARGAVTGSSASSRGRRRRCDSRPTTRSRSSTSRFATSTASNRCRSSSGPDKLTEAALEGPGSSSGWASPTASCAARRIALIRGRPGPARGGDRRGPRGSERRRAGVEPCQDPIGPQQAFSATTASSAAFTASQRLRVRCAAAELEQRDPTPAAPAASGGWRRGISAARPRDTGPSR